MSSLSVLPPGYRMCPKCDQRACRISEQMCRFCWWATDHDDRPTPENRRESVYTFVVPTKPIPKGRPRTFQDERGKSRTITPKKTKEYEEKVALAASLAGVQPFEGEVAVSITAVNPHGSADIDNLAKAILDALNGIAYHDDKQVTRLRIDVIRNSDQRAGSSITVERLE